MVLLNTKTSEGLLNETMEPADVNQKLNLCELKLRRLHSR